ncbi:nitrate- and nitrite sensing domain-containing protein, partial [Streptomyces sp. NPDC059637]|uniref:sensor histidine kinase n=1 Tax=Streptomyces TaxID=1883 RepID=UPI0031E0432E
MQGRFKKDGGAAGDPEPRGGAGRGPVPPHAPTAETRGATPSAGPRKGPGSSGPEPKGPVVPDEEAPPAREGGRHASRIRMRNWSISTRLLSLLALPVVAATSLGVLRIQQSLQNVDQLEHMTTLTEMTRQATLLADALQEERDKSADPLTAGNRKDDDVVATREATDAAISSFTSASKDLENDNDLPGIRSTATQIINQLNTINQLRNDAYTNEDYLSQTVSSYNQLIELLLALSQDMAQATSNTEMIGATRALASFSNAKEYESMQRALISAALARKGGPELSEADAFFGNTTAQAEEAALARFAQIYGNEASLKLTRAIDGDIPEVREADEFRERVLKKPSTLKTGGLSSRDWYDKSSTKIDEMSKIQSQLLNDMEQQARQLRTEAQRDALLNGAVVVLVLGVALVGSFVMARSMIRSLRRLQDTAQEVSQKRLPELVKQLSEADPQDVDTSVEPIGIDSTDEIGRVAHAFEEVHREAVRLAAEQALLRGNVNAMFTNLSRRSQGLIQRQLTLISELESREADPDQLSNLFKLDHLATRMRRNGENLLVLAGEEPGRRWTRPVPLVDVLRAAASEVEQYERIELTSVPATEVAGRVVNDLVHLLAELLENATSFSSPQTKVRVTGHALPDGRVLIEIHDTGIGLSPEDLADINERLANPPTVDVSVSRRMGLFVVGRLSRRHGIRIQLRPSDSGGTTALVMLPVDVTQNGKAVPGNRGRNGQPGGGQPGGGLPGGGQGQAPQAGRGPQPGQVAAGRQRPALPGADGPGPAGRGPAG